MTQVPIAGDDIAFCVEHLSSGTADAYAIFDSTAGAVVESKKGSGCPAAADPGDVVAAPGPGDGGDGGDGGDASDPNVVTYNLREFTSEPGSAHALEFINDLKAHATANGLSATDYYYPANMNRINAAHLGYITNGTPMHGDHQELFMEGSGAGLPGAPLYIAQGINGLWRVPVSNQFEPLFILTPDTTSENPDMLKSIIPTWVMMAGLAARTANGGSIDGMTVPDFLAQNPLAGYASYFTAGSESAAGGPWVFEIGDPIANAFGFSVGCKIHVEPVGGFPAVDRVTCPAP